MTVHSDLRGEVTVRRLAPHLEEHSHEVLAEFGFRPGEIERLASGR